MPLKRRVRRRAARALAGLRFRSSVSYWDDRYRWGGNSGGGSYGRQAEYKAGFINAFVKANDVESVVEFGCGDGNQLRLADYPSYLGVDVSQTAVSLCAEAFREDATKTFLTYGPQTFVDPARIVRGDLALSLDVLFHLIEDDVFGRYMSALFNAADRFVIVYARDRTSRSLARHVRHREFTPWVDEHVGREWELREMKPAPSDEFQDFYVFGRRAAPESI